MNIEEILDMLDELLDKSWSLPLSGGRSVVDDEKIRELLDDVRLNLPSEIKQAKAIVESGNELMNHSNAHDHYNSLTADQIIADVNTCSDKIEALTGVRPTLIRCPFGEYDDHVISAIRSIGMEPIQWDVDSLDWKGISASEITKRVTGKVTNGSIVLFHNAGEHTPEALPDILDYLLGEGYEIVPISKILLTNEETYIDHTGRQCRSAET